MNFHFVCYSGQEGICVRGNFFVNASWMFKIGTRKQLGIESRVKSQVRQAMSYLEYFYFAEILASTQTHIWKFFWSGILPYVFWSSVLQSVNNSYVLHM